MKAQLNKIIDALRAENARLRKELHTSQRRGVIVADVINVLDDQIARRRA